MLTDKEITNITQEAFSPLNCVAEIWDYDTKLRFKVFNDEGECVVELSQAILSTMRNKSNLQMLLSEFRAKVIKKSYTLNNWVFP
jgi:hypothetical protein